MGNAAIAIPGGRAPQEVWTENSLGAKHTIVNVTMSASYATGGDACDFQASGGVLGRAAPLAVLAFPTSTGFVPVWDSVNKKMKLFWCAGSGAVLTEITNATNVSTTVVTCLVAHA